MASEICLTASLSFYKPTSMPQAVGMSAPELRVTVAGTAFAQGTFQVGALAAPLPLGNVAEPHYAYLQNLDTVNEVVVQAGPDGAPLLRLRPGEIAVVPLEPLAVPYAYAEPLTAVLAFLVISL